jgi:hypothetical protein
MQCTSMGVFATANGVGLVTSRKKFNMVMVSLTRMRNSTLTRLSRGGMHCCKNNVRNGEHEKFACGYVQEAFLFLLCGAHEEKNG